MGVCRPVGVEDAPACPAGLVEQCFLLKLVVNFEMAKVFK